MKSPQTAEKRTCYGCRKVTWVVMGHLLEFTGRKLRPLCDSCQKWTGASR